MKKKFILFTVIILLLISLLLIIGLDYKIDKLTVGEQKIVDSFEIYSENVNCLTIKLNVYKDKTYKIVYGYESDDKELTKVGNYNFDVTKIVKNNHKYVDEKNTYTLIDNEGKKYNIYSTNKYLLEFLEEINVDLNTCLELNY